MISITKKSTLTGKYHTKELPITEAQLWMWENGALIQNAMPDLPREDREFLISGITPEEWREHFGDPEEMFNDEEE